MAVGPVEYLVVAFPGNEFNGEILPELAALVESNTVRILDLIFIGKDANGDVLTFEAEELSAFAGLDSDVGGLLGEEDIAYAAETLEPNTSAALLLWEDLWAAPFAAAVRDSGGVLLQGARVPHEIIESALDGAPAAV
ncbi:DUF6325 family protein [uncultured Microbacterium sp.]|uniref:DUF6325 family protein n=1 Tax=uncultured Microbacterium sp. TaxID=191216 RepID=UPI0035CC41E3